jgi:hypothetical protein
MRYLAMMIDRKATELNDFYRPLRLPPVGIA